ncbi:hypothetical protein BH11PLA1_BH11PLA1_00400 [soil metagenome]
MQPFRWFGAASAILGALAVFCAPAQAQTFQNTTAIVGPAGGAAAPYPSIINVAGVAAPIANIRVRLLGVTHAFLDDFDILLVSPTGQKFMLLSDVNGSVNAVNLEFAADGLTNVPGNPASGIYLPTNFDANDTFPAPAPAGPYSTNLADSFGTSANGTWTLYVYDDVGFDAGSIAGGWSLTFNGENVPAAKAPTKFTYQGRLTTAAGAPITTPVEVRFSLWNTAVTTNLANRLGTLGAIAITPSANGVFTQELDFGAVVSSADSGLYLELAVASPVGGAFTTLTPRQLITSAPRATVAQVARTAEVANTAGSAATATLALNFGSGISNPNGSVNFTANIDASPAAGGTVIVGPLAGANLAIDGDEIMARSAGVASNLFLNANGGPVMVNTATALPGASLVTGGSILMTTSSTTTPNTLAFGPFSLATGGGVQNTDPIGLQRFDFATNVSELRVIIGDDPGGSAASRDSMVIGTLSGAGAFTELFRFVSDGQALKPGGGAWGVISDPRAKHDITPLSGTLDRLLRLRGYSFLYNDDQVASGRVLPGPQIGLMADEVERVFPDWISRDFQGLRSVNERSTTALMVEALRDLRAEKDAAAATAASQIEAIRSENAALRVRLERVEMLLTAKPATKASNNSQEVNK